MLGRAKSSESEAKDDDELIHNSFEAQRAKKEKSSLSNTKKPAVSRSSSSALFEEVKKDIGSFGLENRIGNKIQTVTKGWFFHRRMIPVAERLKHESKPIKTSLFKLPTNEDCKFAVEAFKALLSFMGDRKFKGERNMAIKPNLELGLKYPQLRDELYLQVCKQLNENTSKESFERGLVAFSAYAITFPPTRDFEEYLLEFLDRIIASTSKSEKYLAYLTFARTKLRNQIDGFSLAIMPPDDKIRDLEKLPFMPAVFETTLQEIMAWQKKMEDEIEFVEESEDDEVFGVRLHRDDRRVPKVLTYLMRMVKATGGFETVGIFRIPGSMKSVNKLKWELDRGKYNSDIRDPSVYASTLKLWMRELTIPLVPFDVHEKLLDSDPEYHTQFFKEDIYTALDPINLLVLARFVEFARELAVDKWIKHTSMGLDNIAMVFAPNIFRSKVKTFVDQNAPIVVPPSAGINLKFSRLLLTEFDVEGVLSGERLKGRSESVIENQPAEGGVEME